MFGNPQWFKPKTIGWGLVPITWQGWLYSVGWGGTAVVPFLLLVGRHQPFEAMAWMLFIVVAFVCDVRHILGAIHTSKKTSSDSASRSDDVLYIMDSQPCHAAATRNYQLRAQP